MAPKWGMVIDLDKCDGCEACVVACRVENNVAIASESVADHGRAHYWIRVERYWEGEYPNVRARFMPVPCMHCQNAPCEPVCPVYATYHDQTEQLNSQVYNRCIGTRYCANNCPYSVRFFNWYDFGLPTSFYNYENPDVTVRSRGVMEKCTFCIQRIRRARIMAVKGSPALPGQDVPTLPDAEPLPACVQTCPTGALTFGDLSDPNSEVARLAESGRHFRLLEELGTEPVVIYLKELK